MRKALSFLIGAVLVLSVMVLPVRADLNRVERASEGTTGCVGNHTFRLSNSEIRFQIYNFRNHNLPGSGITQTITQIVVYDSTGAVLFDMPGVDPFPAGFVSVVGPRQTSSLNTIDLFGTSPASAPANTPLQVVTTWTGSASGAQLVEGTVAIDRGRDTVTGSLQETRSRSSGGCVTLRLVP